MKVALIGVHGVGKTTTAKVLARDYGFRHCEVEAIAPSVVRMEPEHRQVYFFGKYVTEFIANYYEHENIVFDSHPLLVVPYTLWWTKNSGLAEKMLNLALSLPKVDLLVYLKPRKLETVFDRLRQRGRFNCDEEGDSDYIRFIDNNLRALHSAFWHKVARTAIKIDAEIPAEKRAEIIAKSAKL